MRWLALDIGSRRVGVAVCDADERLASPLRALPYRRAGAFGRAVAELGEESGLPRASSSVSPSPGRGAAAARSGFRVSSRRSASPRNSGRDVRRERHHRCRPDLCWRRRECLAGDGRSSWTASRPVSSWRRSSRAGAPGARPLTCLGVDASVCRSLGGPSMADTYSSFGKFLLLKQRAQDGLGTSVARRGDGPQQLQEDRLAAALRSGGSGPRRSHRGDRGRQPDRPGPEGGNVVRNATHGSEGGVSFIAWDYVPSQPLDQVMARAAQEQFPIAIDNALLIVEKLAGVAGAASAVDVQGQPLIHGFLVPHLALVGNDGEAQVVGFGWATACAPTWIGRRSGSVRGAIPRSRGARQGPATGALRRLLPGSDPVPAAFRSTASRRIRLRAPRRSRLRRSRSTRVRSRRTCSGSSRRRPGRASGGPVLLGGGVQEGAREAAVRRRLLADDVQPRPVHGQALSQRDRAGGSRAPEGARSRM